MTSCYNKPGDRYIVTFEIGYAHSEEFGATSVEEAAALATELVTEGAVCSVLDRETRTTRVLEPEEFWETFKKLTTAPPTAPKYVCGKCGGTDIQVPAWTDPNTQTIVDDDYSDDSWCSDCEENETVITYAQWIQDHARRERPCSPSSVEECT
jgi:hypothetical protein